MSGTGADRNRRVVFDPSSHDLPQGREPAQSLLRSLVLLPRGSRTRALVEHLPVQDLGRWTHIEVYLRRAPDDAGRIPLWQDNIEWSINNYSDDLEPEDVTIFVDNADIVAGRTDVLP